jgi:glycosyltransferase involved in cell wall biosynthesis
MSGKIKVLLSGTSYPANETDWRGVFIKHMLWSLAALDALSVDYCGPPGDFPPMVGYRCNRRERDWFKWLMTKGGIAHLLREGRLGSIPSVFNLLRILWKNYHDRRSCVSILHVNWLQNALPAWGTDTPALITVLGTDMRLLELPGMTWALRQVFRQRACLLAPNADWMVEELEHRFGDVAEVAFMPLGIDDRWFSLKRTSGEGRVHRWLVVSRLTAGKLGYLFDWGEEVFSQKGNELHLFGPMQEEIALPDWIHYHGSTHAGELAGSWFPSASGLITLSRHDEGRPQVMLEAMAAGLPILASRLPAHDNFIEHGRTGWLAASVEEFKQGVAWLSETENNNYVSENARNWVRENVGTWKDCAQRYYRAYCRLLGRDNGTA